MFRFNILKTPIESDFGVVSGNANYVSPFWIAFGESESSLYHFTRYTFQQRLVRISLSDPISINWMIAFPKCDTECSVGMVEYLGM
jgi:hypothetical protein